MPATLTPRIRGCLRCTAAAMAMLLLVAATAAGQGLPGPARVSSGNVYRAGGEVRLAEPVAGDLMAAGGRIVLDHPVAGDATLAAGAVDARADVGDDLRVVGGSISIERAVGGDVVAAGGDIAVRRDATLRADADLRAGNIVVDGLVQGELRASAQKVVVDGELRGPARLAAERIELGPRARILGPLTYDSPQPISVAEGAVVQGGLTREASMHGPPAGHERRSRADGPNIGGIVLAYLAVFVLGTGFQFLVPDFTRRAADRLRRAPWTALGLGAASLVALPVLALLLVLTIFGIPLGLLLMSSYPVLLLAGFVVGVLCLARWLPRAAQHVPAGRRTAGLARFAAALLAVMLLGLVPVAGGLFLLLLSLAGLGAGVLQLRARHAEPGGPPAPQDVPPLPGRDVFPA